MDPEVMTASEAAKMLRCSTRTIRLMVAQRVLCGIRLGGPRGHIRIRRSTVEAYLAAK